MASLLSMVCQVCDLGMDILVQVGHMLVGQQSAQQEMVIAEDLMMAQNFLLVWTLVADCLTWISSCGWDW